MTDTRERSSDSAAAGRQTGPPIDTWVFGVAAALVVGFVLIGVIWPDGLAEKTGSAPAVTCLRSSPSALMSSLSFWT